VFWEVDPSTLGAEDHLSDPEFDKEAWLSMVMLEWGSCGQIASSAPAGGRTDAGCRMVVIPRGPGLPYSEAMTP